MPAMNKRNFTLFFIDSILFTNAMTFLSVSTVIPYFLSTLGADTFQISLASALVSIGSFISQPIFSKKAFEAPHKKKTFVMILAFQRLFFLGYILLLPVISGSSSRFAVASFLACWGIFNFFTGSYQPFYNSLFSKMIPG